MMRILALTNLYPNPYNPHRAAFNRLQFQAIASEHQMQVIAPIAWTGEWSSLRAGSPQMLNENRQRISDGMIIHHPSYVFTPKVLRGWYGKFFVESVRECFHDAVRTFRPDVVLGCWAYPDGWAAVQLAREAGLPVAIKVHGSDVLTIQDHPARLRHTFDALSSADAVIAVSQNLANQVMGMGVNAGRVHTVYNGIDRTAFCPGSKAEARHALGIDSTDPLILFVGNLVPVKGVDVLIDALSNLASTSQRFRAAIIGEGSLRAELRSRIQSRGLDGTVQLTGPRPQSELPQWYRAADLLVLPSWSEGVPNVMLEATACGLASIASRVGGIPEIADPQSLVPPGDPIALAHRIAEFLSSPRSFSPYFSPSGWTESGRKLSAVLQSISTAERARLPKAG
jgi:glycosyltransferase involved in cell wall biosynthesis